VLRGRPSKAQHWSEAMLTAIASFAFVGAAIVAIISSGNVGGEGGNGGGGGTKVGSGSDGSRSSPSRLALRASSSCFALAACATH
jgi:hypothetical protein